MRTAVVVGFDYHVNLLCKKINAHSLGWRFEPYHQSKLSILKAAVRVASSDALITFSGPSPHRALVAVARAAKVPIFVIWAGTDVLRLLSNPESMSSVQRAEFIHLAVAPWLADELRSVGVNALYIPIIGTQPASNVVMPRDRFRVLTYLPEPRRAFYGRSHVYEVAAACPSVEFLVIGQGSRDSLAPQNVKFLGWQSNVTPIIDQCCLIIRVPDHDGMSLMVLEALARGRYVAWNNASPGVRVVKFPSDTTAYVEELLAKFRAGTLSQNKEGLDFIERIYEERRVAELVSRSLDDFVGMRYRRRAGTKRVSVSGLDIFANDIAQLNNKLDTAWQAEVLQFETSYEYLSAIYNLVRSDVWYTVGSPLPNRLLGIVASLFRTPRVVHWVGTDIETSRRNPAIVRTLARQSVRHLTEVDWEVDELKSLGIDAELAPLPPRFSCANRIPPLPTEFTLLTYLPRRRPEFYGKAALESVIARTANDGIKFLIVGGGGVDAPDGATVENLGWRWLLEDVYARSTALFRFTPRDGLSLMVLEALTFGRYVLWTKAFPFVCHVESVESAVSNIREMIKLHRSGGLGPQVEAADFVRLAYDRERCMRRIVSAWDACSRS